MREASALGLLDGLLTPAGSVPPETLGPKAWALSRRTASLSRFLLEHMHSLCKEGGAGAAAAPPGGPQAAPRPAPPSASGGGGSKLPPGPPRSGISPQPHPANLSLAGRLEAAVGLRYRQRMVCLGAGQGGAESAREARCFQVCGGERGMERGGGRGTPRVQDAGEERAGGEADLS